MAKRLQKIYPQPFVAGILTMVALVGLGGAWLGQPQPLPTHLIGVGLALFLLLLTVAGMATMERFTAPLLLAPMTGDRPFQLLRSSTYEVLLGEAAQYLLGTLGAIAASVEGWALGLLALPTVMVYLAFKSAR